MYKKEGWSKVRDRKGKTETSRYSVRAMMCGVLCRSNQEGIVYSKLVGWRCDKIGSEKSWKVVAKVRKSGRIMRTHTDQRECESENGANHAKEGDVRVEGRCVNAQDYLYLGGLAGVKCCSLFAGGLYLGKTEMSELKAVG